MPLTRYKDWDLKHYSPFLIREEKTPFEWGVLDCALFSASAIESFTGVDIASEWRGRYTTELGAFRLIKKLTGGTTIAHAVAYAAGKHGLVEYGFPLMAQRGDLVVVANGDTTICGIVDLNGRHVRSVNDSGIVRLPLTSIVRSWAV